MQHQTFVREMGRRRKQRSELHIRGESFVRDGKYYREVREVPDFMFEWHFEWHRRALTPMDSHSMTLAYSPRHIFWNILLLENP